MTQRGALRLEEIGRRLKQTGDRDLRKSLLLGIRAEAKPLIQAVKDEIDDYIPVSGGAADLVRNSSYGVRTRLTGKNVGVRIQGTGRNVRNLQRINAGVLRHPVFGDRQVWINQPIKPGFFDEPIQKNAPKVRAGLELVLDGVAHRITAS